MRAAGSRMALAKTDTLDPLRQGDPPRTYIEHRRQRGKENVASFSAPCGPETPARGCGAGTLRARAGPHGVWDVCARSCSSPDPEIAGVQRRRRDAGDVDRAVGPERKLAAARTIAGQRGEGLRRGRVAAVAAEEIDDPGWVRAEAGDRERPDVAADLEQAGRAAVGDGVVQAGVDDVGRADDLEPDPARRVDGETRPRDRVAVPDFRLMMSPDAAEVASFDALDTNAPMALTPSRFDGVPTRTGICADQCAAYDVGPVHFPDRGLAVGVLPEHVGKAVAVDVARSDQLPARAGV